MDEHLLAWRDFPCKLVHMRFRQPTQLISKISSGLNQRESDLIARQKTPNRLAKLRILEFDLGKKLCNAIATPAVAVGVREV